MSSPWRTSRRAACHPRHQPSSCHAPPCPASTSEPRQDAPIPRPRTGSSIHAPAVERDSSPFPCRPRRSCRPCPYPCAQPLLFLLQFKQSRAAPPLPPPPQAPLAAAAVDSSSPVALSSIPCRGSFPSSSSTRSPPHPAPSPSAGPPRRSSPSAAARCRRAASPSLLLAVRLRGELWLALEHTMPLPLAPLRLCFAGAAAAVIAHGVRARRATRAVAAPTPRSRPLALP